MIMNENITEKIVFPDDNQSPSPPLLSACNDKRHMIRPFFNTIDKLNYITGEHETRRITRPTLTLVVIGYQSSGKSSLIESLTGISLPRERTRVPLIIKFQQCSDPVPEFRLEYDKESVSVNETDASDWISRLTKRFAGNGESISDVPLTLVVKKKSVPADITVVDLPGIPADDRSSAKLSDILGTYVKLEERVIINVVAHFPCEMSKKFEEERKIVHVFTKADKASEEMMEMVSTNYTGPDYICIRNRLANETHEEARAKETRMFKTHHLLSKLDKSMVGVPNLAQKLSLFLLDSVSKCLGHLVRVLNLDLNTCIVEQNRILQQQEKDYLNVSEAIPAFKQILEMCKISLLKEFDEFPHETEMNYCCVRLREMCNEFNEDLKNLQVKQNELFLIEEIVILNNREWCPQQLFPFIFQTSIANITTITDTYVARVWDYLEAVVIKVLAQYSYPPKLFLSLKKAAKKVISRKKESFRSRLFELLDMRKIKDDPAVISSWENLKTTTRSIVDDAKFRDHNTFCNVHVGTGFLSIYPKTVVDEAFDVRTRMVACLEMVRKNVFDSKELNIPFMFFMKLLMEMETEIVNELTTDYRYKLLLKESHSVTRKRWKLKNRIELLQNLKKLIENTIDEIFFNAY